MNSGKSPFVCFPRPTTSYLVVDVGHIAAGDEKDNPDEHDEHFGICLPLGAYARAFAYQ